MNELKLFNSQAEQTRLIREHIAALAAGGGELQILEAGCGNSWSIDLDGVAYRLTGVDLDKDALDLRVNVKKDLHEMIHADLRTVDLGQRQFDVVYNSFVLEHIKGAEGVLDRFVKWLRPGGKLILLIPDPQSAYGFATKMTPHWFHVLFYRFALGKATAGKPGYAPYATYYDPVVSRHGIHAYCKQRGLAINAEFGDGFWKPGKGLAQKATSLVKRLISLVSGGALSEKHTYLVYVISRN
jgi:SAM-dependent methyltransferase